MSVIAAARAKQSPIFTVTELDATGTFSVDYPIEFVDLNYDGRRCEPQYRKVKICVSGVGGAPRYALFRASEAFEEES